MGICGIGGKPGNAGKGADEGDGFTLINAGTLVALGTERPEALTAGRLGVLSAGNPGANGRPGITGIVETLGGLGVGKPWKEGVRIGKLIGNTPCRPGVDGMESVPRLIERVEVVQRVRLHPRLLGHPAGLAHHQG